MRTTTTIAAATLLSLAGTANAQVIDWDNNLGGLWTDPANWSPMTVPNSGSHTATIALGGTYDVFLNTSLTIGTLSLTNPNASVTVEVGDALTVDSGILNNGEIVVNSSTGGAVTSLFLRSAGSPMGGTGSLRLNGFGTRARLLTTSGADIVHGVDHTIHGFGRIEAVIQNDGTIDADAAGQPLHVLSNPITNNGTMRASNTGTLNMDAFTLTQGPSGLVVADGGTVLIGGLDIIGGTLNSINAGSLLVDGPSTFDAVTVDGPLTIEVGDSIGVTNDLTNNATLTVNSNTGGAVTTLEFSDASTLGGVGEVILNGFSTRARILANNGTLTHQAPHTIHGFGQINGTIDNGSPITADVSGQVIQLHSSTVTNSSTLSAINSATLDINNTTIDNTGGGTMVADGGTITYSGVTLLGGAVETINAGSSFIDGSAAFDAVTFNGDVTLEVGDTLSVSNGLTNNGTLLVNNTAGGAVTSLQYTTSSSLGGSGTVVLNAFSTRSRILTDAGITMTHAAPHTIRGYGQIIADVVNDSLVSADVAGQVISIDSSTIDNNGTLRATAGATLDVNNTTIENDGGTILADAGTVNIGSSTINGGTIDSLNDGILFVDAPSAFDAVTLEGPLTLEVADVLAITNGLTNNSDMVINNSAGAAVTSLQFDDDSTLGGTGSVTLNANTIRARLSGFDGSIVATQGPDHSLLGEGQVAVDLINHGTIAPGFPGTLPIRTMAALNDIINTDSANHSVEVAGINNADLIDSTAAFHADGTLTIELIDGFDPTDYWVASIVQADAGVTGRYDTIVAPVPLDTRLAIRARYLPDEIRIGAVCKPDIDFNGLLNFFDITAFIVLFNAQDPDADITAPFGAWNFFDIAAYIGQFNNGCP